MRTRKGFVGCLLKVITGFLVCAWIIVSIPCCHGNDDNDTNSSPSIPNLDELITYLRHGDERLVRYNVPR